MTACIYYKLAIERGLRGCDPDGEFRAHGECGDPPIHHRNFKTKSSAGSKFGINSVSEVSEFHTYSTQNSPINSSTKSAIRGSLFVRKNLENERLAAGLCKSVDVRDLDELIR